MDLKISGGSVAVIFIGALSFYGGVSYQVARYDDLCSVLGGDANSAYYPVCITEGGDTEALWLGPIRVAKEDIIKFEIDQASERQTQVHLTLSPVIAAALTGVVEQSVGRQIEIRIGGELINTVRIAEAVTMKNFTILMTNAQAEQLAQLIVSNSE